MPTGVATVDVRFKTFEDSPIRALDLSQHRNIQLCTVDHNDVLEVGIGLRIDAIACPQQAFALKSRGNDREERLRHFSSLSMSSTECVDAVLLLGSGADQNRRS